MSYKPDISWLVKTITTHELFHEKAGKLCYEKVMKYIHQIIHPKNQWTWVNKKMLYFKNYVGNHFQILVTITWLQCSDEQL